MNYVIMSGKYENGNEEQQIGYKQLLGEDNIQYKFDLYFHWYNLVHELGHCLVEKYGIKMTPVQEEMYVNEFAVSYYRYIGELDRLVELQSILVPVIENMPSPVPEDSSFISYFERIWGTEALMNVMTYGYFQLRSVVEAIRKKRDFSEVVSELGVNLQSATIKNNGGDISASNAEEYLTSAIENIKALGLDVPQIRLELVDNPMIQCAQPES
ncbi:hypothetical protein SAMN02910369_01499 [Lachnospiraceae bacterium NE2001]|nr:hypothetical protein SAMN02910369_01499 [Lachnospiraceae bacterium NE2001]